MTVPTLALLQLGAPPTSMSGSLVGMILRADLVTKGVLILLVVLSLLSWAIMFAKWRAFRVAESRGRSFVNDFERARGIDEATQLAQRAKSSAFTAVFASTTSVPMPNSPLGHRRSPAGGRPSRRFRSMFNSSLPVSACSS